MIGETTIIEPKDFGVQIKETAKIAKIETLETVRTKKVQEDLR